MSLRLRLFLLTLLVYAAGGYFITRWVTEQIRPRYLESMEETLVDVSVLLAGVLEHASTQHPDPSGLRAAFDRAQQHAFTAQVFSLQKTFIDLRVYVTDASGRVVFDSSGRHEGQDFSRWNDVARTLRGTYGARSSRDIPGDDDSQVIYVAAPIRADDRIIGVVSVGKPTRGINGLVALAKRRIVLGAVIGGALLLVALAAVMAWVVSPIGRLTGYARAVRDGVPVAAPRLPGRSLQELAVAFEEMRDSLEGRKHAERYTQALAHEVKAPLAAIRGAAELLEEPMPDAQRDRFLTNIRQETARIQQIVDRLLELSSIEARKALAQTETVRIAVVFAEVTETVSAAAAAAGVSLSLVPPPPEVVVRGDSFLLRQAVLNLVQNAVEFSPRGAEVELTASVEGRDVQVAVSDRGAGVPEYALPRVFDRFYSLPRPGSARKSTGIGLALVREIAHLHRGEAMLANRDGGGARATLRLPLAEG